MSERVLVGAGVGTGIAIGRAFKYASAKYVPWDSDKAGSARGLMAISAAIAQVEKDLGQSAKNADPEAASILEAMKLTLSDASLLAGIKERLADGANSQRAVSGAFAGAAKALASLGEYFAARATDIEELGNRVIQVLSGEGQVDFPTEPFILVADSVGPLEMSRLANSSIVGLITSTGSATSHTAILARAANLPTVVGSEFIQPEDQVIVDSSSGQVLVNPDQAELKQYREAVTKSSQLDQLSTVGLPVDLYANLGSSSEAESALAFGAQGVGLFRTELLFLGEKQAPSLEKQILEYSRLLSAFPSKRVIVRVLDLDTDKPLPFLTLTESGKYANRGFQALLANIEVLETQLEALAESSRRYLETELWVMAPMITSSKHAKAFVDLAKSYGLKNVGVMIEVPEVCQQEVLDEILETVDFVSIGTNDLTQYTLNLDRVNSAIALSDVRKPEVLGLIERVVSSSREASKPVGICGEAAGDPESAKLFIEYGVTSLSLSPALLPSLVRALRN
ncbi:MAG: phosphoenolpyruvate--protein phosphotransferase [Microbacteriaceae bacterium]|nr:phosphoenolpyruvate--protein phosphotransferase [Microbacteriaceae bacterium]